jgi:hypothetical protein
MDASSNARGAGGPRRIATLAEALAVVLVLAVVFACHARWIFTHFSNDAYLCDSGWIAFLFEQADPLLRNPRAVVGMACAGTNAPTFLAHHLSPHIFLFGAPFSVFGISGIDILAYHQGLFFSLFLLALYLVIAPVRLPAHERFVAMLAALAIGTLANVLLQAAAYPHYETAMFAVSSMAIAAGLAGYRRLFVCCLAWLPMIREDGGLYAAVVCFSCLTVEHGENRRLGFATPTLVIAAGIGIVVSVAAFVVKATYFPGFDAFSKNFAGDHWRHVTRAFVVERAQAMLANWNIAPVLAGSVVLSIIDVRYVTGIVLLAPLFLLHMLSVRPEHGHFTLYFALPWLLPVLIWLAVLVRRMSDRRASGIEKTIFVVLACALTAPVQALIGTPQARWDVALQAFRRPIVDIAGMKKVARSTHASYASSAAERGQKQCASMGIAALIPDDLAPGEVISPDSDISSCLTVLLLRGDMHYAELTAKAKASGFRLTIIRENAEVWLRDTH